MPIQLPHWCVEKAKVGLKTAGLYETGISLFWLLLEIAEEDLEVVAGDPYTYDDLDVAVSTYFDPNVKKCKGLKGDRLIFPLTVILHSDAQEAFHAEECNRSMQVVTGHLY